MILERECFERDVFALRFEVIKLKEREKRQKIAIYYTMFSFLFYMIVK